MREDGISLFGFLNLEDKVVFEKIIGVSGIGPKTALAILSSLSGDSFREAIESEDHRVLTSISGIGLKTAQRLILYLKGKLGRISKGGTGDPRSNPRLTSPIGDAVDALIALGYPRRKRLRPLTWFTKKITA